MHGQKTGKGQVYLGAYKDSDGDWPDGGKNYVPNVPVNAPAETFWSVTLYNVNTRCLIQNKQEIADPSLADGSCCENNDGSITIYMGPDKPAGDKAKELDSDRGRQGVVSLLPPLLAQKGVPRSNLGAAGYRESKVSLGVRSECSGQDKVDRILVAAIVQLSLNHCRFVFDRPRTLLPSTCCYCIARGDQCHPFFAGQRPSHGPPCVYMQTLKARTEPFAEGRWTSRESRMSFSSDI